ncbi:TatD family hydrolase [Latilactobacillus sakei]|uniref:TatD family hydrolase n=1 Tax=Latilactobacillus sakei TaxID=1599 RepID=A0AAF0GPW0_LATSK|nr:TatD family hydrolase [Latilactobacillus sakei]KRK70704.1 hypothetical protein FD49_GL001404 [Latilactobacillus sakei subsp. sakei DSM 20017 = JCM 1157]MCB4409784.1 TatD family deoxyribonuclease [Latilactobacillus sakei]MDB1553569.1 TatD family hydrolase [Latilactobacillus sakei]MDG9751188.1 TatD family hydrolase [Latilactobacillus sakei]TDG58368.1 hypothetical protein C5L17_000212 [Latilactobacillus sakei subsp. sakei]
MQIFDSHTHLNDTPYAGQEADFIQQAADLGVTEMAIVGSDTVLNDGALRLAQQYKALSAIIGWHPESAKDYTKVQEAQLIEQLQLPEVVALGEIGLDYHWDTSPRDVQRTVFERQIEIAKSLHMPISVHTRDALEDTYKILKETDVRDCGGIIHSFNGDSEWLKRFMDLGMQISFSGVVSFKNAHEVHEAAKLCPLDVMLVETDAPYLTPTPYRGKQNQPGYTRYVVEAIAKLREVAPEEIAAATYANAHRIFKLGAI